MTSSKGSNLEHLARLIEAELALLADELYPLLKETQTALVGDKLDNLQRLAERETVFSGQLAALEAQRVTAVAEIAHALGTPAEDALAVTMDKLLAMLPTSPETERIAGLAADLDQAVHEIGWLNADNHHLTHNRLEYTDFVMKLITRRNGSQHYSAEGRVLDGPPARAMLDDTI